MSWWRRRRGGEDEAEQAPRDGDTQHQLRQMAPLHSRTAYTSQNRVQTTVVEVGTLHVHGGVVAIGDPGMGAPSFLVTVPVPPGRHRVTATAFVHTYGDGRRRTFNASASLVVSEGDRASREILRTADGGNSREPEEMHWVSVDSGTCGFADARRLEAAMADERWDAFIDQELPRVPLPWVVDLPGGGDLVAVESGLGDGGYPVFGDYDGHGDLLAVHVNFALVTRADLAGVD